MMGISKLHLYSRSSNASHTTFANSESESSVTSELEEKSRSLTFNLEANEVHDIPSVRDDYSEEEFVDCWYSWNELKKIKKCVKGQAMLFERRLEKSDQLDDFTATPESRSDEKRGICYRGVERLLPSRNDERMKRIEQSWEALFALKDILRRKQKKDRVLGWMKKSKKSKPQGTSPDEILAQKLSTVTLTSKEDAIARAEKDAEVAQQIFAEPEDLSLASKVRRSQYMRKQFPANHHVAVTPTRLELQKV